MEVIECKTKRPKRGSLPCLPIEVQFARAKYRERNLDKRESVPLKTTCIYENGPEHGSESQYVEMDCKNTPQEAEYASIGELYENVEEGNVKGTSQRPIIQHQSQKKPRDLPPDPNVEQETHYMSLLGNDTQANEAEYATIQQPLYENFTTTKSSSDHYLVFCVRKFRGACKKQHKNISTRQMKNFDQNEFVNDLLGVDWRDIVRNTEDINVVVNNWTKIF